MLSWKKDSADISHDMPEFHVRYIGAMETFTPNGKGCTTQPLQKLWDNSSSEKNLCKVAVTFSVRGIHMSELVNKHDEHNSTRWFSIEDISYCAADKNVNDRLFCWISKDSVSGKLELHAFLCSSRDKARTMASVLSRAFQLAYKDWIAERQREKRKKTTFSVSLLEASSESMSNGYATPPNSRSMYSPWICSSNSMDIVAENEKETSARKQSD